MSENLKPKCSFHGNKFDLGCTECEILFHKFDEKKLMEFESDTLDPTAAKAYYGIFLKDGEYEKYQPLTSIQGDWKKINPYFLKQCEADLMNALWRRSRVLIYGEQRWRDYVFHIRTCYARILLCDKMIKYGMTKNVYEKYRDWHYPCNF